MMFREKSISKLYAYALAAVFALTLAGCGGGGSGAAATDPVDPAPMPDTRLSDAQEAAAAAAMLANTALNAAKEAVSGVSDIQDYDNLHYDLAGGALNDARRAKQAADAANTAAMAAGTAEDAEAAQAAAEAAQADAEDALALANTFVGAVQAAKTAADDAMDDMQLTTDLMTAVADATTARDAAVVAAGQATMRLQELVDSEVGTNAEVHQATLDKAAADLEVMAANTALSDALDAQTARDLAAARTAVTAAQTAQANAEAKRDAIGGVKDGLDMAAQEVIDLADAKAAAMTAAGMARDYANQAKAASELAARYAASDSSAVVNSRQAYMDADEAATAAEEAATRAQEDTTSADAGEEQIAAEGSRDSAQTAAKVATDIAQVVETTYGVAEIRRLRVGAGNARNETVEAAEDAQTARNDLNNVKTAVDANVASAQAEMARAGRARTNVGGARTAVSAALAAQSLVDAAIAGADAALSDANDAVATAGEEFQNARSSSTVEEVRAARDAVRDARTAAQDALGKILSADDLDNGASAAAAAKTAANMHVIGLFKMANAYHINASDDDLPDTELNESTTEANEAQDKARADHSKEVAEAVAMAATARGDATATAAYPADSEDQEDGDPVTGRLAVAFTPGGGTPVTTDTVGMLDDDDETVDVDPNAKRLRGLGTFGSAFDLASDDTRALIFTDKKQGTPESDAVMAEYTTSSVSAGRIERAVAATAITETGLDTLSRYDHDGDSDTAPLEGMFTCSTGCNLLILDGNVVSISGYSFSTTTPQIIVPARMAEENDDYLVFGIWLTEVADNGDDADGIAQYTYGAFANGGVVFETPTTLTGDATYNGSAAGVYSDGSKSDFFEGDVTLTADFDAGDEDQGSITGMIDNIIAGGATTDDVINLNDDGTPDNGNITATGEFAGDARMGAGRTIDAVTTYPYNGTWGGQFYGPAGPAADGDATGADTLPPAAAGTFGVTGTLGEGDAAVTKTYVGAFGARR